MGLYDLIIAEITCPNTEKASTIGIQIKWTDCSQKNYKLGDNINFAKNMSSLWIQVYYCCSQCNTVSHPAYINIRKGRITEIISESEYQKRGLEDFLDAKELTQNL